MKDKQKKENRREKKTVDLFAAPRRETKTKHRTGYHKPIKNHTTNYRKDDHKAFCSRCMKYNGGCPLPTAAAARKCSL